MSEQNQKPLNHVEEDDHYTQDWEDIQKRLDELQKKHNQLVKFLLERRHDELLAEFEE